MLDRNSRNLKRAYECVSANVVRCRAKRAPCNANVHRSRALLTITALAAVAAFGASAPPVAAEHPGPPVERDYYPFFQTSGQSMWGPGGSIAPDDFTQEIISISWDEAVSDSRTVSITAPDVCMDDCAPDIICEAGCWTVCLGCQWLCDHDACIRNCENACPEVCIDACVSDYVNLPGGTFGGEMEASTSGQLSLDARFHGFTSGEVSVDYPVRVRLTTPSIDSFEPGDIVVIDSTDVTRSGATLSTTPPAGAIDIRGTVELSASASADAWLFSRYGTQVTFDAGTSIDIAYPAGETDTLDITPTFSIVNTFSNNTALRFVQDLSTAVLDVWLTIPAVTIVPSNTYCTPEICVGPLCLPSFCLPALSSSATTLSYALLSQNTLGDFSVGVELPDVLQWELEGFDTVEGNAFPLDPELPPTCDAGGIYSAGCMGATLQTTLNATASDPDGDPLTVAWTTDCPGGGFGNPNSLTSTLTLDPAFPSPFECSVTLSVDDGHYDPVFCDATVRIGEPCGNGACDCGESHSTCPQDCPDLCGNGLVDPGEECDDGNTANGDCCSSTCQFEASGTVCRPPNGLCDVTEVCTGVSADCPPDIFLPDGSDCSDGMFCNGAEICQSGVCTDQVDPCPGLPCVEASNTCLNPPGLPADDADWARKHRYISIDPTTNGSTPVALRVELTSRKRCSGDLGQTCRVNADCRGLCDNDAGWFCTTAAECDGNACIPTGPCVEHPDVGLTWWVQPPQTEPMSCNPGWFARVERLELEEDVPFFNIWTDDPLHIGDCEIIPVATYGVRACLPPSGEQCSAALTIGTIRKPDVKHFGDVAGPVTPALDFTPPDGFANVIDIQAYLKTKQNCGTAAKPQCHPAWVDLHGLGPGNPPPYILNVSDLQMILKGVQGERWTDTPGNLDPGVCP